MSTPTYPFLVRSLLLPLVASLATACLHEVDQEWGPDIERAAVTEAELGERYNIHRLLDDDQVEGGEHIGADEVQSFLEQQGSFLASYVDPAWNASAASLIVERSRAYGINPLYMLARIQIESSLIQSGTSAHLAQATGCGCPDGGGCAASYAGFGNQIECGAAKMRNYLSDLDATGHTVSGWRVGVTKATSDPCAVTPANRVTAALYTYTPWVGAYGRQCRRRLNIGGSTLVALVYNRYANAYDWPAAPAEEEPAPPADPDLPEDPPARTPLVVDSNNANNDVDEGYVEASSNWSAGYADGYYGTGYYWASASPVSDAAAFHFHVDEAGEYTIDGYWVPGPNRSSTTPFLIVNASGDVVGNVRKDQRVGGASWQSLGTFPLTEGWNRVLVSRWAGDGDVVVADAVRIR